MKGSMEGVLPMLALFIMSMALATQSIPIGEALGQVVSESTSDVERIVNTRAYTDFYFYNYLPQSGEYTLNDEAYNLSKDGGGLEWNSSSVDDNMYANLYLKWINESDEDLNSRISGSEGVCNVPSVGYSLTPYSDYDTVNKRFFIGSNAADEEGTGSPLQADCSFPGGDSFYSDSEDFYSTEYNATNNRYLGLARESVDFFVAIRQQFDNIESSSNTKKACGSTPSTSEVEPGAVSSLEQNVVNTFQTVKSTFPKNEEFTITQAELRRTSTFTYGTDSDILEGYSTTSTSDGDCCSDCGDDDESPEYWQYRTVTSYPSITEINWTLKDSGQKVLVGREYKNLAFSVEPYTHYFQ